MTPWDRPTLVVYTYTGTDGADEPACRDNEMGYMFYYNLDGIAFQGKQGTQTAVGGDELTDIQPVYWSGAEFNPDIAWQFDFGNGLQGIDSVSIKGLQFSAWAVRDGDVGAAVPEPGSLALLAFGLAGLGFARRRRQR